MGDGPVTLYVKNLRTGIVETVGETLLPALLERKGEDGEAEYEQVDSPESGNATSPAYEIVPLDNGKYAARVAGTTVTDASAMFAGKDGTGYKSEKALQTAVRRIHKGATFSDAPPPTTTEQAAMDVTDSTTPDDA